MYPPSHDDEESCFRLILKRLHAHVGIDFSLYREGTIRRRMARRMAATRSASYRGYLETLERQPGEYDLLARDFAIKVSRFFRNQPLFDVVTDEVVPAILGDKSRQMEDTLRIWCAGCACGEEAYSAAIVIVECLRRAQKTAGDFRISIFGTDIDEEALEQAEKGEYPPQQFREARQEIIDRYFVSMEARCVDSFGRFAAGERGRRVIDSVRDLVHFCRHDLTSETMKSPPAGVVTGYDLIFCRNVLIYFSRDLQMRALSNLVSSLSPGGYLILGKSESIPDAFQSHLVPHASSREIYRKPSGIV